MITQSGVIVPFADEHSIWATAMKFRRAAVDYFRRRLALQVRYK